MIKIKNTFVSDVQPAVQEGLWLKVAGEGVSLYLIEGWKAKPLKVVNDTPKAENATEGNLVAFDANGNIVDSGKKPSDFELSGSAAALLGTGKDKATTMTLYGLKKYVNNKLEALSND